MSRGITETPNGKEAQRYSPYIEGVSDGADWCADKIRGLG